MKNRKYKLKPWVKISLKFIATSAIALPVSYCGLVAFVRMLSYQPTNESRIFGAFGVMSFLLIVMSFITYTALKGALSNEEN